MSKKYFYVTTPIYYVNDVPHIGNAYTTLAADILARFHRLNGYDVFFLTGTDEHGQKTEKAAEKNKTTPLELANQVVENYRKLWKHLHISNDDFIRTTEDRHKKVVLDIIQKVIKKGDIYLGQYEDWYCIPCEAFWTQTQIIDDHCPTCSRKVEKLKEESYFFRMSKYEKDLLAHIEKNPDFIQPESRKNEVVSFIKTGLRDLSISRTTISWGIPVPEIEKTNKKHVLYVWFDALINYLSGIGYLSDSKKFSDYWPSTTHLVGKDILRFHAVYWPTMLMSIGLPLPKKIFAHGWITGKSGEKISKSKGNAIDPYAVTEEFELDPLRYFLFREIPFGSDGNFSRSALIGRINSDLADDYGNLLNRTIAMTLKYQNGKVLKPKTITPSDQELIEKYTSMRIQYKKNMDEIALHKALTVLWEAIRFTNKYIDSNEPWKLSKDESKKERLNDVLGFALEAIRIASVLVSPFMPQTAEKALSALGIQGFSSGAVQEKGIDTLCRFWENQTELQVQKSDPLFKKHEI